MGSVRSKYEMQKKIFGEILLLSKFVIQSYSENEKPD